MSSFLDAKNFSDETIKKYGGKSPCSKFEQCAYSDESPYCYLSSGYKSPECPLKQELDQEEEIMKELEDSSEDDESDMGANDKAQLAA